MKYFKWWWSIRIYMSKLVLKVKSQYDIGATQIFVSCTNIDFQNLIVPFLYRWNAWVIIIISAFGPYGMQVKAPKYPKSPKRWSVVPHTISMPSFHVHVVPFDKTSRFGVMYKITFFYFQKPVTCKCNLPLIQFLNNDFVSDTVLVQNWHQSLFDTG